MELKPCPFCGDDAYIEDIESPVTGAFRRSVGCFNEGCMGYQSFTTFERKKDAMEAWNMRSCEQTTIKSLIERKWDIPRSNFLSDEHDVEKRAKEYLTRLLSKAWNTRAGEP